MRRQASEQLGDNPFGRVPSMACFHLRNIVFFDAFGYYIVVHERYNRVEVAKKINGTSDSASSETGNRIVLTHIFAP